MKTAAIFLFGLPGIDKKKPVQNFSYTDEKEVKDRVKELQKGYCEGERVKLETHTTKSKTSGKDIKIFHAISDSDFSYVAYLGMKFKENVSLL